MNKYFSISRFLLLIKLELHSSRKAVLITLDVIFVMLFFIDFLLSLIIEQNVVYFDHDESFAFTLIIGGFVLSSLAFSGLSNTLKRPNYLTLPVSALERMSVMWLLTSVVWVIFFSLLYYLYTLLVNLLGEVLFDTVRFQSFTPFREFPIAVIKYYMIFQGVFMIGAAHFKRYVFPKILLVLILIAIFTGIVGYFFMFDTLSNAPSDVCLSNLDEMEDKSIHSFWQFVKVLFWWGFGPLCWCIAYLGLRDQEV